MLLLLNRLRNFRCHHTLEFLIIHATISVAIGCTDHLIQLLLTDLQSKVVHDDLQLIDRDCTSTIAIKYCKGLAKLFLDVSIPHLTKHQGAELRVI